MASAVAAGVVTARRYGTHPRMRAFAGRHWAFGVALLLGTALRLVMMLGYPPAFWFGDSYSYLGVAMHGFPYPVRPQGYAFFLWLLEPFHSFAVVTGVQHAMGLAVAALGYRLARSKLHLPGWGATLTTLPVLLDAYEVGLEQMIMSDTLFLLLLMVAVTVLLTGRRPGPWRGLALGLVVGAAVLTRSAAAALIAAVLIGLLLRPIRRRVRWRIVATAAIGCALPVACYAVWFHGTWDRWGLTNSGGIYLYGRVAPIANCATVQPPSYERYLCPPEPLGSRLASPSYLWYTDILGPDAAWQKFSPVNDKLAGDFARRTIRAQPGDFASLVLRDMGRTFHWSRGPYPTPGSTRAYRFPDHDRPVAKWRVMPGDATADDDARAYAHDDATTTVTQPYAGFLRGYQDAIFLRGPIFAGILVLGLAGVVRRWHALGLRGSAPALVPWLLSLALVFGPPVTASFGYRYLLAAVPLATLAAGAAFASPRRVRRNARVGVE